MDPIIRILGGALASALLLAPIACWLLYRKVRSLKEAADSLRKSNTEQGVIIAEIHQALDEETRKKLEYFKSITDFEREKLQWRDLYWKQSREHGNAQQRLLMEREQNFRLLHGNKIRPYVDPYIATLVGAFREEHYEPAKLASISQKIETCASDPVIDRQVVTRE